MNQQLCGEKIIPDSLYGHRVDSVLAQLFPQYSRSQLTQWLKEGMITINGASWKPKIKVQGGERVVLEILPSDRLTESIRAEPIALDVIYEDDALLVVNKPAGLVVHPGAGNPSHTLVNGLLYHDAMLHQLPRAGIIHRLDKDTTGLLLVAKTLTAYTELSRQMQAREIQRHYFALVCGHVVTGGRLQTYFGRHHHNRLKMAVLQDGKVAITDYQVYCHYQGFTLLDITLLTGRTHQIRVHMDHINHPIVGDMLYNKRVRFPKQVSTPLRESLQNFKRQALHAYKLTFLHPVSRKELTLTAPVPSDLQELLTLLPKV